jgi:hypothetical protein
MAMGQQTSRSHPRPQSDLARVTRERFWALDPLGVVPWSQFTSSEYFETADRTPARAEQGDDLGVVEADLARELREDWELEAWQDVARNVVMTIRVHLQGGNTTDGEASYV